MKIDVNEFYRKLGIPSNASKEQIKNAYHDWFLVWDNKEEHTDEDFDELYYMCKIKKTLLEKENKATYQQVTHVEEAPAKTTKSGKILIAALGTAALTTSILAATLTLGTNNKKQEDKQVASSTAASSSSVAMITEPEEVIDQDLVNDNEFMQTLAQTEWDKIVKIKNFDSDFAPSIYDSNVVYEIIRWIHHGEEGYTGDWILSNEDANARLSELVTTSYDIAQLYEGTSIYDNIKLLRNAVGKISPDNGSYNDEFDAYKDLKTALGNMNPNNFVEVITIRVLAKHMISNERFDTMRDIAFDKSNLSSEDVQLCKNVFNSVNDDSIFSASLQNAINEDNNNKGRVLS